MAKKIPLKIKTAVHHYITVLKRDIPVTKVFVYGSCARGTARKNSDIDIAIISTYFGKNPQKEGQFLFRKLWEVPYSNIEPIGYSPRDFNTKQPSPLLHEIRKYGIEIRT